MQVIHQIILILNILLYLLQIPIGDTNQCPALHQSVHRDLHRGGTEECEDHAQGAKPAAQGDIHSGHAGNDDCGSAGGTGIGSACTCRWRRWWKSGGRWRHSSGCHTSVPCPSHSSCNSGCPAGERIALFFDSWCLGSLITAFGLTKLPRACKTLKHRHRRNVTSHHFFDYYDFHH